MSFLLTILLVSAAGLGLLDLLRLRTGNLLADAGLAWLVGCGWYGWAAVGLRIGLGIPYGVTSVLVIALLPGACALARRRRRPERLPDRTPLSGSDSPVNNDHRLGQRIERWLPRPWIFWVPVVLYVLAVSTVIVLHGINTPTHTDDAVRLRAFTPLLALEDEWSQVARGLLTAAGGLPTFVPTVAWRLTGRLDHFHINYTVLCHMVAFLCLAVGLGIRATRPQRGWATAFAILSLPFLVYHLTSTYQDAVVALFSGAALLLILEYARGGDAADASLAFLLAATVSMIKRDGAIMGATLAAVLLVHLLLHRRREKVPVLAPTLHAFAPMAIYAVLMLANSGRTWAAPIVDEAMVRLGPAPAAGALVTTSSWNATKAFVQALLVRGNAGMLFWALPIAAVAHWRRTVRPSLALPLAAALLIFLETAVSSIWLLPKFTIDQSTVHRALLTPSVLFAAWLAALLTEPAGTVPPNFPS